MDTHLKNLARRVEDDPFFLSCALKRYAQSEGLNDQDLAVRLRCDVEKLALVRLCRVPQPEDDSFCEDIEHIAARFALDADVLIEAIRRGQAILQMSQVGTAPPLLAARDGTADHDERNKP